MTIIVTCAGHSGRWARPGIYGAPRRGPEALIRVAGKPLVQWAVESVGQWSGRVRYLFVVRDAHEVKYDISGAVRRFLRDPFLVLTTLKPGYGQLATAMKAIDLCKDGSPVIVASCNIYVRADLLECATSLGGDYRAFAITAPLQPAQRTGPDGEWRPLTDEWPPLEPKPVLLPVGLYYFRDGRDFAEAGGAAIFAAARARRPSAIPNLIDQYERRGWKVQRCPADESWRLSNATRADSFARRMARASR